MQGARSVAVWQTLARRRFQTISASLKESSMRPTLSAATLLLLLCAGALSGCAWFKKRSPPPAAASPAPVLLGKLPCAMQLPHSWRVQQFDGLTQASDGAGNLVVNAGVGGVDETRKTWQALRKVRKQYEDNSQRWFAEVASDAAHAGLRSYIGIVGDARQSCLLQLYLPPEQEMQALTLWRALQWPHRTPPRYPVGDAAQ
ncbi:hypothetical protein V8J88_18700 [Massilia sp. W12]|uniref:hypothetical protein n=1 Tax=Massilia sp. W12 TaxID=3126507 RepID=UPI0030CD767E